MLADDDEDDRLLFKMALKEVNPNINLTFAEDGEILMDVLSSQNSHLPSLLFLDLNMPFKNGKECLKEIRNNEALDDLLVVIYSTSSSDLDIEETYNLGANLYIEKPVYSRLKTTLSGILQLDWSLYRSPDMELFLSVSDKHKSIIR